MSRQDSRLRRPRGFSNAQAQLPAPICWREYPREWQNEYSWSLMRMAHQPTRKSVSSVGCRVSPSSNTAVGFPQRSLGTLFMRISHNVNPKLETRNAKAEAGLTLNPAAQFCDVALPVPLDTAFSYRVPDGMEPAIGGRVLVPFRQQRMSGIVVALHDRKPAVQTKNVVSVLDPVPVLDEQLMRLGKWIADYYLAPLGEVFRTMLPLGAEFKRTITYRITEQGHLTLHLGGMSGSSARARRTPEDQLAEFRVLDYLANRDDPVREQSLRSATRVSRAVLTGMLRKKWLDREDISHARDATRIVKVAVLRSTVSPDEALQFANGATGVPARRA